MESLLPSCTPSVPSSLLQKQPPTKIQAAEASKVTQLEAIYLKSPGFWPCLNLLNFT